MESRRRFFERATVIGSGFILGCSSDVTSPVAGSDVDERVSMARKPKPTDGCQCAEEIANLQSQIDSLNFQNDQLRSYVNTINNRVNRLETFHPTGSF